MKKLMFVLALLLGCTAINAQDHNMEFQLDAFGGLGVGQKSGFNTGLDFTACWCCSDAFTVGVGTGLVLSRAAIEVNSEGIEKGNGLLLPVYLRGRYKLASLTSTSNLVEPYLMGDLGYSINLFGADRKIRGVFLEPSFGLSFNQNFNLGIGWRLQPFLYNNLNTGKSNCRGIASDVCLHVGFAF